jgi:hypothetical protein
MRDERYSILRAVGKYMLTRKGKHIQEAHTEYYFFSRGA